MIEKLQLRPILIFNMQMELPKNLSNIDFLKEKSFQ
jgi:hypothetical protein